MALDCDDKMSDTGFDPKKLNPEEAKALRDFTDEIEKLTGQSKKKEKPTCQRE